MYLRYAGLVLLSLMASVLNLGLAPLAVPFATADGWLPHWLWWLQTPDNPLDGDGGWKEEHRRFKIEDKHWKRWYNRTTWLYRNPMYGFAIDVLGARVRATDTIVVTGDTLTSNRPIHDGLVRRTVLRDGVPIYFQWYCVKRWGTTMRCLRINLGWKLWGPSGIARNCQLTFSPNPFMGLSKD
jgi:hypothetical protein